MIGGNSLNINKIKERVHTHTQFTNQAKSGTLISKEKG